MTAEIKIFKNTDEIASEFANMLQILAQKAEGKIVHIALSGGSTPKAIFNYLSDKFGKNLANPQFHFWWGDERCVPPNNTESNFKWANELWFKPIGIKTEQIHRIYGEAQPQEEAIRYSAEIENKVPIINGWPKFDLMLLGIGEDGHTASIFPHQKEFIESNKICEVATHPENGQKRITLTGKVINNSGVIVFLSTGEKKSEMVYEILKLNNTNLPASHIHAQNGKLIWLIDREAAKLL